MLAESCLKTPSLGTNRKGVVMRNGLFIALALTFSALGAHAASFLPLGFLPSSEESFAKAISADGTTVVGTSGVEAFRWTAAEGMVGLSDLPGGGSDECRTRHLR